MTTRIDYAKVAPDALKAMMEIEKYVAGSNLKHSLCELVKLRASQINGCDYCIAKHSRDALRIGETEQRLQALKIWRKTSLFSERERAALAWTEALTLISENEIPDALYKMVLGYFSEEDLIALTMAINAINGWNRLAISFKTVSEHLEPPKENADMKSEV